MESLSFDKNSPKTFILAANRLSDNPETEDQVWSLVFNHSDSHPFHLYTTYGLQARTVQVFPDILIENQPLDGDGDYNSPPTITQYTPGFLRIVYRFNNGLAIKFDTLTSEPSVLHGNISFNNQGEAELNFQFLLSYYLLPLGKGMRTRMERVGSHQVLSGQTENLFPVMFMSGGPIAAYAPHPALTLPLQLAPGKSQTANWALAAKTSWDKSFQTARRITARSWHQVAQKHLMDHAHQTLQIRTGDPNWDRAFSLAQAIPDTHFIHQQSEDAAPSVVRTRLPDQPALNTHNLKENDDLTTLELIHLGQVLLPQRPELMASLVKSFLDRILESGQLHSRRNTSPFMKRYQEPPLLAGLSLEIFEINGDESFLTKAFSPLTRVTQAWLFSDSDAHGEKPLAWQTPDQCQLHSGQYVFDIWEETGGGLDIQTVESPALAAMLLREIRSLRKIAEILGELISVKHYKKLEVQIRKTLDSFWEESQQAYLYRDCQSQISPEGEIILSGTAQNRVVVDRIFELPQRLVCHLRACDERTRICHLTFTGIDHQGKELVEAFKPGEIRWIRGRSHLTTKNLFSSMKSIKIEGLAPEDEITLETADFTHRDITCLAPVWSGNLSPDRLDSLLENTLDWQQPSLNRGIPEVHPPMQKPAEGLQIAVNVLWNTLIIQGLARKGHPEAAAGLFSNLMTTIIGGLQNYDGFFSFFQVKGGKPLGKKNGISSLAPLKLFLDIAGIRIFTPFKVAIWGTNPFPWPIDVNWRGLSIHKEKNLTHITFPDGTTTATETTDPVVITPESLTS